MGTALIVDDDPEHLLSLSEVFRSAGYSAETLRDLSEARGAMLRRMPDVALLKERIDDHSALEILNELDLSNVVELYLMSPDRNLDSATEAMQLGVSDYFEIPVDRDRLLEHLKYLSEELETAHESHGPSKSARGYLVGESVLMHRLYRTIRKCAPSEASILLTGENGTGKELVARTIHELSARANGDFVAVNCGAIPAELMESELFGHKKGSFTGAARDHKGLFERANGGTLFLDEISEMDSALQVKLLRVLETRSVSPVGSEQEISTDARIVAATNRNPKDAVAEGRLREDLYYRLAQFPLRVPALRERRDDIELLARHFLEAENEARGVEKTFSDEAIEVLRLHDWPGNVRELRNAVVHGHLLAGEVVEADDLPDGIPSTAPSRAYIRSQIGMSMSDVERRHLLATLAHFEGDKKKTAEVLGISLKTLYNRLKKYGVS
jgi:DNA-binding NtrC family response regulator